MNSDQAWRIIGSNLARLVSLMVTVQKGNSVDVFCDQLGKSFSFSKPSGEANTKLCSVIAPDLASHYGLRQKGSSYVDDDGGEFPQDQLASRLTEYITNMKNEGAEWGWEFKVSGD